VEVGEGVRPIKDSALDKTKGVDDMRGTCRVGGPANNESHFIYICLAGNLLSMPLPLP